MTDKDKENEESTNDEVDDAPQTISLFLTIGLVIGALVIGLVVGYVVAPSGASSVTAPPAGTQSAPPLSPDEAEGGQLPPGHPTVPGDTGGGAVSTPDTSPSTDVAPEATE